MSIKRQILPLGGFFMIRICYQLQPKSINLYSLITTCEIAYDERNWPKTLKLSKL